MDWQTVNLGLTLKLPLNSALTPEPYPDIIVDLVGQVQGVGGLAGLISFKADVIADNPGISLEKTIDVVRNFAFKDQGPWTSGRSQCSFAAT